MHLTTDDQLAEARHEPAPARSLAWLSAFWTRPVTITTDGCAVTILAVICAAAAAIGAVHVRIYGHDIFVMLDAGWRVLNGQRPDVDFRPSMGPLAGLLFAAALKLAHNSVRAVGYASSMVGAFAGFAGYWIARRRIAAVPATLAAAALALIAVAPFPIGLSPNLLSQAMLYNRYGYALAGLVALEAFLAPPDRRSAMSGGFLSGAIIVALVFLKPSYALVAAGFVVVSFFIVGSNRSRMAGIATGCTFAALATLAYLRFDLSAIWTDLAWMFAAKGSAINLWNVRWAFFKGLGEFLPLAALSLVAGSTRRRGLWKPYACALLAWTAGAMLLATNGQLAGFPLNAIFAIVLIGEAYSTAPAILLGLIAVAPLLVDSTAGLGVALFESVRRPSVEVAASIDSPPLSGFTLYDVPEGSDADLRSNGHAYATYLSDGIKLIRRYSRREETVYTLDVQSPFSYALLRRPARGGAVCLSYRHTFNDQHKPPFDWLFGSADIVMVPKRPSAAAPDAQALFRNYLPGIHAGFRLCAQSDWWELYKRPANLSGCAIQP